MWDIIMFLKKEGKGGGGSRWWLIIKREYNFQATFHTGGPATTTLITPIVCVIIQSYAMLQLFHENVIFCQVKSFYHNIY